MPSFSLTISTLIYDLVGNPKALLGLASITLKRMIRQTERERERERKKEIKREDTKRLENESSTSGTAH